MANPYKSCGVKVTPQSEPIPGKDMVKNSAGGYTFAVDKWSRLDRFLILGSEGGTYYIKEKTLTIENAQNVIECIKEDGPRVVHAIVAISDAGRAPKNTPALFALAMCAAFGDEGTKRATYLSLPKVARTGYHLLMWVAYCKNLGGTGMGWRKAVARWFNLKAVDHVAYQAVKYQQREGWALADVLRLAHVKPATRSHAAVYSWIVGKQAEVELPNIIKATEVAKMAPRSAVISLITKFNLPREVIPTEHLNDADIWNALLDKMPMHAMLRNLGKMTSVGLLAPFSSTVTHIVEQFSDTERIRKSRLHPLSILVAMRTYQNGSGFRGKLTWEPVTDIVDVLDEAFYTAFGNVEPTNKNIMLALDVSGSMSASIAGMPIDARTASAAMALVTANVEPHRLFVGFTGGHWGYHSEQNPNHLTPLDISPRQRLDDVVDYVDNLQFGGTDCALPMLYATKYSLPVDTFIVYTDNETWAGRIHPAQALRKYRNSSSIDAKLIVVATTSTGFSIADPEDPGMLDVVGFDTAAPNVISEFSR